MPLMMTALRHCVCLQMLQILREKAENRNPDEYYTAMQHGPQRAANPDAGCMFLWAHEMSVIAFTQHVVSSCCDRWYAGSRRMRRSKPSSRRTCDMCSCSPAGGGR